MNYGLYLSAAGVLTNSYRQDVFANNLANVNTVGFKPDLPVLRTRPPEAIEDPAPFGTSNDLLERLGGGVLAGQQRTSFAPGPVEPTGRPLDAALTDRHSFFALQHTDPRTGNVTTQYTRDGRFMVNPRGELVTPAGQRLLDANLRPITLDPAAPATLNPDGEVVQNNQPVAHLRIARIDDVQQLEKIGNNAFAYRGPDAPPVAADPRLQPGALENSATDPITTLMHVTSAAKTATANANLIKYHDTLMDGAINTLGRIT